MNESEHALQRRLVELSTRLSERRAERRDEARVQATLYAVPRQNVTAAPINPPEPPRAA